MKTRICDHEAALLAALARGHLDRSLLDHLATCADCAELQFIWQSLVSSTAAKAEELAPLPEPSLIWWRAELAEKHAKTARAIAAIDLMQKLAVALTLVAMVAGSLLCFRYLSPSLVSTFLIGSGMCLVTAAVLYGWARGRI